MYCISILVCQKDLDTFLAVQKSLHQAGFLTQIQFVKSYQIAIDLMKKNSFDLLFLQTASSFMEAHSVDQILQQNTQQTPVILVGSSTELKLSWFSSKGFLDWVNPSPCAVEMALLIQRFTNWHTEKINSHRPIFLKTGRTLTRFTYGDIEYIQANGALCTLHTPEKEFSINYTISELETMLPTSLFKRVHKSYIVSLFKIEVVQYGRIQVGTHTVPVGLTFKKNIGHLYNILEKTNYAKAIC